MDRIIPAVVLDALFCSDEIFEEEESKQTESYNISNLNQTSFEICEDEEISSLLCKESDLKFKQPYNKTLEPESFLSKARTEAVEWILNASSYFGFSAITSLLAVNYIDRFISSNDVYWTDQKPWMSQLAAVTCLSLAAKMEEIEVPLLLDLQVGGASDFMFEPKSVQRMEILILSALQWRMNPVTPLSFLECITSSLGLKDHLCGEFLRRCEITLLSLVLDCRSMLYLPSETAAATALHVVNCIAPSVTTEFSNHLLAMLKIDKGKLDECCELITQLALSSGWFHCSKRKFGAVPGSPNGVMDVGSFSSYMSNTFSTLSSSSSSSSVNSSPEPKKRKTDDKDYENAIAD